MKIFTALLSLCAFALFTESPLARAGDVRLDSETSAGGGTLSESLTVSGNNGGANQDTASDLATGRAETEGEWNWSAGYIFSRVPVGSSSNKTNSFDGSVGYKKQWDGGAGLNYASTPQENLKSFGPNLWLGYEFSLGQPSAAGFRQKLEPKFSFRHESYTQTFAGTAPPRAGSSRTLARPTTGSESIAQNEFGFDLSYSPLELVSGHVGVSAYRYDKNVNTFIGLLDTPRAVSSGAANFSDTLGGFPKSTAELGVTFFPWETYSLDLGFTRTKVQTDSSTSKGFKAVAAKDIGKSFKAGVGFEHDASVAVGVENLGILDLAYSF